MIIIVNKNKPLSEKKLTQIFNLLKHPLRRAIIKQLSKSPRLYSEILKNLNIQESSVLNYHLRELDDLLISKDFNGKYQLNEIGKICLQLVIKVREKEDIHRYNKLQFLVSQLKTTLNLIQITFSVLIIILIMELYFLNIIDFSSILEIIPSGVIFSTIFSTGVFIIIKNSESNGINKLDMKEKIAIYATLFAIWILIQTILKLLYNC